MAGEGQAKPELRGRENHTARQGKDIALQAMPSQEHFPPLILSFQLLFLQFSAMQYL